MSPDSVFWRGRAWYTLPAISVKVRESLVQFPGDCTSEMGTVPRKWKRFVCGTPSAQVPMPNRSYMLSLLSPSHPVMPHAALK